MKFLAIDTSGKYLTVLAHKDGYTERVFLPDCAMKHSVVLMDEICGALERAGLSPRDCDFFAAVVGPGSFTGIRIGISTVKGLCLATGKPALSVTSFDCLAYAEGSGKKLALIDAGHRCYYASCFDGAVCTLPPCFLTEEEIREQISLGYAPVASEELFKGCKAADPCEGLLRAVLGNAERRAPASSLCALYLRKSSAEEQRP